VQDQVQRAGTCELSLPEHQPMSDEKEQLLDQTAELVKYIGDCLDRDTKFKRLVSKGLFWYASVLLYVA